MPEYREPSLRTIILTGVPGSGKTSVARSLASRFARAVHIEGDVFWHFIESGYLEPWTPESHQQNEVVMTAIAKAASTYARAGYFTIIDAIVAPEWFFHPLTEALAAEDVEVAYAVLQVPLDVAIKRAASRPRTPLDRVSVIEELWTSFSELGSLHRHAIPVGNRTPEELAGQIVQLLDGDQLRVR